MLHISLTAENIFYLGNFPISNSIFTTWLVMLLLIITAFIVRNNLSIIPGYALSIAEIIIGGVYNLFEQVNGEKNRIFFPLVGTLFIYIVSANWIGLLPGVGTIGINKIVDHQESFIPLFRSATADLNTTLALAIIAVFALQYYGVKEIGLKTYFSRFINFSNPLLFFSGLLEAESEITKVVSFAFRLFGNIFAGEVLLAVVAFLIPLFVPLPFLMLELFVGFIQALVFAMLTAVFLSVATQRLH